jgi:uncharacterized protein DUF5661
MATRTLAPKLSDQEFSDLLAVIGDADSVEMKLTLQLSDRSRAGRALGVDPLEGKIRQVYFFDTPDLALNKKGLVVRARRVQQRGDDSVVKLRPVVPSELPAKVRRSANFGVEVDAMPGGAYVCSGSMKHMMGAGDVKSAVAGKEPLRKLFSKEQRALYAAHAPAGLELDDLTILGPILVLKVKFAPEGYGGKLVAELWLYPDNSMLLELSTKCAPSEAFQVAAETRAFLTEHGIDLSGEQATKTKKALEFFSRRLTGKAESQRTTFTSDEARKVGSEIGIDWSSAPFEVEQFRMGMDVELEHGLHDPATDVTGSDPVVTGKIALAHLNEFADYYVRLERMEEIDHVTIDVSGELIKDDEAELRSHLARQ